MRVAGQEEKAMARQTPGGLGKQNRVGDNYCRDFLQQRPFLMQRRGGGVHHLLTAWKAELAIISLS